MSRWLRFALPGLLVTAATAAAQLAPQKAEQSFKVVAGLEFKLWACEPLFVNPTCMDIDHLGRVWVCESVNYRNKLRRLPKLNRPAGDRIVILSDSKGTGKADTATTFYQSEDTLAPLGIAVAKDPVGPGWKVFVCQSPDILVFEDKDGDGKADGPPKKLLSGFGGYDHDHGVHGILIGPDMKLYFSVGDAGVNGLQSSDKKGRSWKSNDTDCRAGTVWRCDLDGKNLQLLGHNFRNEYEPCVDSFGNVFVSDNDDDGNQQTRICHVLPGGNYGYHPRGPGQTHWHEEQPGVVPMVLRTFFGSPTGICFYEGKLLPKKYHGQLLHTDAGPRHVRAYHLKAKGASYEVEREDMVESSDNWFRPADVCVAPDGSVFVADWYDPGVGGHGMGDTTRGRIYRLAPKGNKYEVPKVDLDSKEGFVKALGSPNLAVRYMALAKMRHAKADKTFWDLWEGVYSEVEQSKDLVLSARLMWLMALLWIERSPTDVGPHLGFPMLKALEDVGHEDPRMRVLMLRISKRLFSADRYMQPLKRPGSEKLTFPSLVKLVLSKEQSLAVLREALVLLRDEDPAKIKEILYELMKRYDGKDRFYLASIGIAVGHHDDKRREALLADFDKQFTTWDDKVAGLVWELRPPRVLPLLEKRLVDDKLPAEQRAKVVDILATSQDKGAGLALIKLLDGDPPAEVRDRILENLRLFLPSKWKDLNKSPELSQALDALLKKPQTRGAAIGLIAAAGRRDRLGDVVKLAKSKDEPAASRKAAVAALGLLPSAETSAALGELLKEGPADLRPEVARSLGELAKPAKGNEAARAALKALQGVVGDDKADAVLREAAVTALSAGRPGTQWLIGLKKGDKLPGSLVALTGRLLRNSPYRDLQNQALIAFPAAGKLDPKKLPALAALAARKGDAAKGKALLEASLRSNLQCLKCHTVRGVGGVPPVGPDLSVIGKKASRENLFESILYPSKAIADQYLTWTVETDRGLSISGLIVEENADVVVLRDAEGRDTRVPKKTIDKRTKGAKSLMPDDVIVHLSENELVDLVEYLFSLKTPALAIDAWNIIGPFDNGSGMEGLDKVFAPEKGIDLKATYEGKAGKVVWKTVRSGPGGYFDLRAHYAPSSANIVSYLTAEIESPAEQDATVVLGSDDGIKVWVNDKLVHTAKVTRAAAPEQDTVKVKLKKGSNCVVLKINNGDGAHGFFFTVLSEQELKVAGKK